MHDHTTINYIIATYSGVSKSRELYDDESDIILQKHLKTLCKSLESAQNIKQITIIKPLVVGPIYQKIL